MIINTAIGFSNVNNVEAFSGFCVNPLLQFVRTDYFYVINRDNVRIIMTSGKDVFVEYSYDQISWTRFRANSTIQPTANVKCFFRGINPTGFGDSDSVYTNFKIFSGNSRVGGNIRSLIDYRGCADIPPYAFYKFFAGSQGVDFSNLDLSADNVSDYGYGYMFEGVTHHAAFKDIKIGTLGNYGMVGMFNGCNQTSFRLPNVNVGVVGEYSFKETFKNCTKITESKIDYDGELTKGLFYDTYNGCSLLTTFSGITDNKPKAYTFYGTFMNCTSMVLPQVAVIGDFEEDAEYCCGGMYNGCSSLTTMPEYKCEHLSKGCYNYAHKGNTSLVNMTEIKAKYYAYESCFGMFYGCTSIVKHQSRIDAEYLASTSLYGMYLGCTSMTKAPVVSAYSGEYGACEKIYYGCTSLKGVEFDINDSRIIGNSTMYGCSNLQTIRVNFDTFYNYFNTDWVKNVNANGKFVCPVELVTRTGDNGVPSNWEIVRV